MPLTKEQFIQLRKSGLSTERIIEFEKRGQPFNFSLIETVKNIPKSAGQFVGGIASAIAHPIQTTKALGKTAIGGVEKLIPGKQESETQFNAVVDFFKERYGGVDNLKRTIQEDPVGFASDIAIALSGAGAVISGAGKASKIGTLGKIGAGVSKVSKTIEPISATTRAIGKGVGLATKGRTIAPFAKSVDVPTLEAARKIGVELPASGISKSRIVPLLETMEAKGIFGDQIIQRVESAANQLNQVSDDLVKSMGKTDDLVIVGKNIEKGVGRYRTNWLKIKNELYTKADDLAKEPIKVSPNKTVEFIKDIIEKKRLASKATPIKTDLSFFENQLKMLQRKGLTNNQLKSALYELNQKINFGTDPVITGNKAILRKMIVNIADDLDDAVKTNLPELSQAIDEANTFYKQGLELMNSSFGKKIVQLKGRPDKIIPAIITPSTSLEDIPRIFELVGKENVPAIRTVIVDNIFKNARGLDKKITPAGITRELKKIGELRLQKILLPKQFEAIKNIEKVAQSFGKFGKILEGSQTAFLTRIFGEIGLLFINPFAAAKLFVGDIALNKFINSPTGQKFLTTGVQLTGKTGEGITKFGEKAGMIGKKLFQAGRVQEILE